VTLPVAVAPARPPAGEFSAADEAAMRRALELAARGLASTDPNPRVGCVLELEGRTVGEGWHERPGLPHAEVLALREAGERAVGATAYVTLEPCAHFGRTPPCADALIAARVARVVYALADPNPRVNGQGAARIAAAGIRVESGLLGPEAEALNSGFLKRLRHGRPWVRLKQAMSLDGRVALANGKSRWITGEAARADVQAWRARSSCILTGSGTVLADDPSLNVRIGPLPRRQPLRVVLDSSLRTPPAARLLAEPGETLLFAASDVQGAAAEAAAAQLLGRGARIESVARAAGGLDLSAVLARLANLEVNELWIEAGPRLAGAWLASGFVDEWLLYVAPLALGPAARPLVEIQEPPTLAAALRFELRAIESFGPDLRLSLAPRPEQG
jgi:diaminohydroxyphosphoribosylaminopyrimidine deaminase/5-amino-6-(5-phosphoribosylamino)uracil reductase